jgi:hypothetical protein
VFAKEIKLQSMLQTAPVHEGDAEQGISCKSVTQSFWLLLSSAIGLSGSEAVGSELVIGPVHLKHRTGRMVNFYRWSCLLLRWGF